MEERTSGGHLHWRCWLWQLLCCQPFKQRRTTNCLHLQELTFTRGTGTLIVAWSAVTSATAYDVNYSDDGKQTWERAASNVNGTTYTIENVNDGLPYYVSVRGVIKDEDGAWQDSDLILPECPDGIRVAPRTHPRQLRE